MSLESAVKATKSDSRGKKRPADEAKDSAVIERLRESHKKVASTKLKVVRNGEERVASKMELDIDAISSLSVSRGLQVVVFGTFFLSFCQSQSGLVSIPFLFMSTASAYRPCDMCTGIQKELRKKMKVVVNKIVRKSDAQRIKTVGLVDVILISLRMHSVQLQNDHSRDNIGRSVVFSAECRLPGWRHRARHPHKQERCQEDVGGDSRKNSFPIACPERRIGRYRR